MKKYLFVLLMILTFSGTILVFKISSTPRENDNGAPPYVVEDLQPPDQNRFSWFYNWKRPDGPPTVALQVGHWKNNELPEELERLRGNSGSSGGGKMEWEVNFQIAILTNQILGQKNINVEILPATVPQNFWSDVFIAIHADGSEDVYKRGFKVSTPWRDYSGKARSLLEFIEEEYQKATGFEKDPNITNNMRGYYAFAWWRYDHAVHPMTASIILETGFLTNATDRKTIVSNPEISAEGLASGIIRYLESQNLLPNEEN